jgi:uncharacterized phosphosugar-binding protein
MVATADGYVSGIRSVLGQLADSQAANVTAVAPPIADALRAGDTLQAFGTGHSEAVAMDFAGRAGGLVPTNRILLRDLVVFGGKATELRHNEKLERDSEITDRFPAILSLHPEDVFVVALQSRINGGAVGVARLIRQRGHRLIAITSVEHTLRVTPGHPSGQRLADLADVVPDNGAPYGDVLPPLESGGAVCRVSSVTDALSAQPVVAEVVRRTEAAGEVAPVYLSANVPGGDEHNHAIESRYAGRIRRTA